MKVVEHLLVIDFLLLRTFLVACPCVQFNVSMTFANCNDALLENSSLLVHALRPLKVCLDLPPPKFLQQRERMGRVACTLHKPASKPWKEQVVWLVPYHDYKIQSVCCVRLQGKTNEQSTIGQETFSCRGIFVGRGGKVEGSTKHS